jgi:DNA-binding NtrC family response regulator
MSEEVKPKVDGLELLKRIKMRDSHVCFLMITGYPNIDSAIDAIKDGADDYVNKPFHLEDIRIKVDRLIDAKRAKKALKKMTGVFWALIISIPLWLILGIILGIIWK